MEQVRCFVAIELPEGLKMELVELVERLKSEVRTGMKWVDPQRIHLTLKFLGNVAASRLEEIGGALAKAVPGIRPFELVVGGLGVFPSLKRVRVVWVGVSGETDELQRLQHGVESALESLGFAAESRHFTPHLTLARVRNQVPPEEQQRLAQLIDVTRFESRSRIEVDSIRLMRSQLTRQGAIYSCIKSIELGG